MAFGDRLKEAREAAGLTRPQLAEKLGITKSAISNYENGVSSPKEDVMLKIFNALDVEPNFLFQDSFVKLDITQDEADIINTYRKLDERGKKAVCDTLDREYKYVEEQQAAFVADRTDYIKKHALPFAAAGGDSSNLAEAQELYDAKRKEGKDGK